MDPETDKMVNTEFIEGFTTLWIINTSRGKNIVTADLVAALKASKVLGAGLDVLEYEKLSLRRCFKETIQSFQYLLEALMLS
jgi:D-3-phosphoglycerate dehydrogenase